MKKIIVIILFSFFSCASYTQDTLKISELRAQTLEALKNYRYCLYFECNKQTGIPSYIPFEKKYFNEQSKMKLQEILDQRWTNEEKRTLAEKIITKDVKVQIGSIESMLSDTIKYRFGKIKRKHYQKRLDSLKNVLVGNYPPAYIETIEKKITDTPIANELVYKAGMLDDSRFNSTLNLAINDSHFDKNAVKLTLARLRVDRFHDDVLELLKINKNETLGKLSPETYVKVRQYQYDVEPKLLYICSNESITEYSKFLECNFYAPAQEYDVSYYPIPSYAIEALLNIILNKEFREYFKRIEFIPSGIKPENVSWAKQWLKLNYGKYQLNRDYYPGRGLK